MNVPCTPCGGYGYHEMTCCVCEFSPCSCPLMPVWCDTCGGVGHILDEPEEKQQPAQPVKGEYRQ